MDGSGSGGIDNDNEDDDDDEGHRALPPVTLAEDNNYYRRAYNITALRLHLYVHVSMLAQCGCRTSQKAPRSSDHPNETKGRG